MASIPLRVSRSIALEIIYRKDGGNRENYMGWKGVIRSLAAAARAAERDARRRQRDLEARRKVTNKMAALEQAAYEVELYENYVDRITSVHKEVRPKFDWKSILGDAQPTEPTRYQIEEAIARQRLESFRPGFFVRLFGLSKKRRAKLEQDLQNAKNNDERKWWQAKTEFQNDVKEWLEQSDLAHRVLNNDPKAFVEALKSIGSFAEIEELGSHVQFAIDEAGSVSCTVKVHSKDIIPSQAKSLLSSGRLSQKEMPKRRYLELYQDYVCGVVLRVASEVLAILPIDRVIVTATDSVLSTKTGNLEEQPIVSACIPRATMDRLNLAHVDPSDSLTNFVHEMDFNKTRGFQPVKEVDAPK